MVNTSRREDVRQQMSDVRKLYSRKQEGSGAFRHPGSIVHALRAERWGAAHRAGWFRGSFKESLRWRGRRLWGVIINAAYGCAAAVRRHIYLLPRSGNPQPFEPFDTTLLHNLRRQPHPPLSNLRRSRHHNPRPEGPSNLRTLGAQRRHPQGIIPFLHFINDI